MQRVEAAVEERQRAWRERHPIKADDPVRTEEELRAMDMTRGIRTARLQNEIDRAYLDRRIGA